MKVEEYYTFYRVFSLLLGTLILVIFSEVLLNVSDKLLTDNSILHLTNVKSSHL